MAAAVGYQPVVLAHDVQIGNVKIPIGRITTSYIHRKDDNGKDVHEVRVWTQGGMGLNGKQVIIDFQLQTAERTNQFYQDLLAKANASFSLYASSIKPDIVKSGDKVKGVIEIQFQQDHYCEEFDSAIAPVFFLGFHGQVLNGSVLKLTSTEGTAEQITEMMNKVFAALNRQTHFETAELLYWNQNPRFYAQRRQEPQMVCPPHRDPHYFVSIDGKVQKETAHFSAPPEGHFKRWDETDSLYYAPEPLEQPSEEKVAKMKANVPLLIEYAQAISKVSSRMAEEMAPFIEELKKEEPRSAVEWEILFNLMEFSPYKLTEAEEAALETISNEFTERFNKVSQGV